MTSKEKLVQDVIDRDNWLCNLKPGDEVCFTNKYNITRSLLGFGLFGGPFGSDDGPAKNTEEEQMGKQFCKIQNVRGILPDGAIVVADAVFTPRGKIEAYQRSEFAALSMDGELVPVTDELRELAQRLEFIDIFSRIKWELFDIASMNKIVQIINEVAIKHSEKGDKNESI